LICRKKHFNILKHCSSPLLAAPRMEFSLKKDGEVYDL